MNSKAELKRRRARHAADRTGRWWWKRLRLLGLYHGLGRGVKTLYVGTYDWRGPRYRRQMLSPTLEELLIPLSETHFSDADARSQAAGGRVVIDSIFPELAHLSPHYVSAARKAAIEADVVVFSHPWIYPLVRDQLDRSRQFVVYDAHNVEGILRMELLDDGGTGSEIVTRCNTHRARTLPGRGSGSCLLT